MTLNDLAGVISGNGSERPTADDDEAQYLLTVQFHYDATQSVPEHVHLYPSDLRLHLLTDELDEELEAMELPGWLRED